MSVISLNGAPVPDGDPACATVVALLETYLERARRGEITAVAVAHVNAGNRIGCGYDLGTAGHHLLIAAQSMASFELLADAREVSELIEFGPEDVA